MGRGGTIIAMDITDLRHSVSAPGHTSYVREESLCSGVGNKVFSATENRRRKSPRRGQHGAQRQGREEAKARGQVWLSGQTEEHLKSLGGTVVTDTAHHQSRKLYTCCTPAQVPFACTCCLPAQALSEGI